MITITVYGGLGNQLFQLFTLLAYRYRTGNEVVLFRSLLSCNRPNSKGELSVYWNTPLMFCFNDLFQDNVIDCGSIVFTMVKWIENRYVTLEDHISKCQLDQQNIFLQGCFQSFQYFEREKDSIFETIKLNDIKRNVLIKNCWYDYGNTVSMHFRIGDYANLSQYHPVLPVEYYLKALQHLILDTKINSWNILYFYEKQNHNEVDMMIQLLKQKNPELNFIPINHDIDDWEQMIMMSLCRSNIIANSTFSWWGAYFNTLIDKKVYYPSLWHGPQLNYINTEMLFPPSWTRIDI